MLNLTQQSRNQIVTLGVLVTPMKIPPSLCGIRVIREIRGQKNQPRITQISRKNYNESHFHPQWRAAGSWKLGEGGGSVLTTESPRIGKIIWWLNGIWWIR